MTRELPPFVQDLLDRRVDPLADAAARDWLLAHPECLPAFAALRADLAALCDLAPKALCELAPLTRVRRRRRLLPLGAFALALVALVCSLWRTSAPDRDVPSPLPRPDFAAAALVHAVRTSTSVAGPHGTFASVRSVGCATLLRREEFTTAAAPTRAVPWCVASVVREEVTQ